MPGSSEVAEPAAGRLVPTPIGDARVFVSPSSASAGTRGVVVLGHGAGGGFGAPDLATVVRALPGLGFEVVAVEQPWKVAGGRIAPAPHRLDVAWRAVLESLQPAAPLILGGRSAGARVACRTAAEAGATGVIALAFPLHPPGRPERSRLAELAGAAVPVLVVQGERDTFGRPEEFPLADLADVRLCPVPAADHSFAVPASAPVTRKEALAAVVRAVTEWLDALVPPASVTG